MTRNIYILLGIIVIIVVVFVVLNPLASTEDSTPSESSVASDESLRFGRSTALLASSDSGEIGGVDLVENTEGQIDVRIVLENTSAGASQPAHLHSGSCDALGQIIFQLNPVVDGSSETVLSVSGEELQAQLPFVINVHKSEDELGVNIACGSIPIE